jgi:hypothetical protein
MPQSGYHRGTREQLAVTERPGTAPLNTGTAPQRARDGSARVKLTGRPENHARGHSDAPGARSGSDSRTAGGGRPRRRTTDRSIAEDLRVVGGSVARGSEASRAERLSRSCFRRLSRRALLGALEASRRQRGQPARGARNGLRIKRLVHQGRQRGAPKYAWPFTSSHRERRAVLHTRAEARVCPTKRVKRAAGYAAVSLASECRSPQQTALGP